MYDREKIEKTEKVIEKNIIWLFFFPSQWVAVITALSGVKSNFWGGRIKDRC